MMLSVIVNSKFARAVLRLLNRMTGGLARLTLSYLLIQIQRRKIKSQNIPDRPTIGFYYVAEVYRNHTGNIAEKLHATGYNVNIFTELENKISKELTNQENVFVVIDAKLGNVRDTELLICVAHSDKLPQNVKKCLFVHDIQDSPVGDIRKIALETLMFDYMFLPSQPVMERMKQLIGIGREYNKNHHKLICLVPGGYIKLDTNMKYFQAHKADTKTIVYAPTLTRITEIEEIISLPLYGEQIVGKLLEEFPDYMIIFRPHPTILHSHLVMNIVERYKAHTNFVLDDNAASYMENYAKSAIMITDISGTAYTYAFTTLRPVVFFSHRDDEARDRLKGLRYLDDRAKVGYVARNVEEMVEKARLLLTEKNQFAERIRKYRDSEIFNIGRSEQYFVDNIDYILQDKTHPDWEYV